jgi:phosphohistidine phosphatase SixA
VRLVLVRHAEAASGRPDALRELTSKGRRQARELGKRVAREHPDALLTSPLRRARQTADAIGRAAGLTPEESDLLGPGASAEDVRLAVVGRGETVVVVGHNPDCATIAAELGSAATHGFPPAGVAVIELDS